MAILIISPVANLSVQSLSNAKPLLARQILRADLKNIHSCKLHVMYLPMSYRYSDFIYNLSKFVTAQ